MKGRVRGIPGYYFPPEDQGWWQFISLLTASDRPVNDLVANIIGLAYGSSVNQAHTALNAIQFYLGEWRKDHLKDILNLIEKNDAAGNQRLRGYICEAMSEWPSSSLTAIHSLFCCLFLFENRVGPSIHRPLACCGRREKSSQMKVSGVVSGRLI